MEVLEEEELNEMNRQQASYKKMTEIQLLELKEMEALE
jgi:SRSO17 transposase